MSDNIKHSLLKTFLLFTVLLMCSSVLAVQKSIRASDAEDNDQFGHSVATDGEWMAVGAPYAEDLNGTANAGAVYMYRREGLLWKEVAILYGNPNIANHNFGGAVALGLSSTGPTLVVGASGTGFGQVYVYQYGRYCQSGTVECWIQKVTTLTGSAADSNDYFGASVAIFDNTIVVGASLDEDPNGTAYTGAAYIFRCVQWLIDAGDNDGYCSIWDEQAQIVPAAGDILDYFGSSVAISGDRIVVGAKYDDDSGNNDGAVYVYQRTVQGGNPFYQDTWAFEEKLTPSVGSGGSNFGASVDVSGDYLVAGAPLADLSGLVDNGLAYVYEKTISNWQERAILIPFGEAAAGDQFGTSVAISSETGLGDFVLVGNPLDDDLGSASGSALLYQRNGSSWNQIDKLLPVGSAAGDQFGYAVDYAGGIAVVTALLDDYPPCIGSVSFCQNFPPPTTDSGQTYIFSDPVPTAVTVDLSSNSVQASNPVTATVTLNVSGISPGSSQLNGKTLRLGITSPDNSVTNYMGTTDSNGSVSFSNLTDFTSSGTYSVTASFSATSDWFASTSLVQPVSVGLQYAVIIEGSVMPIGSVEELSINKSAERIYQTLLARGFTDDKIYYFSQDQARIGVDAFATYTNINQQLTSNISWDGFNSLLEQSNSNPAPVHFFLVGHAALGGTFYLNPDGGTGGGAEMLTATQIDSWLSTLELNPLMQVFSRSVIIGAPNSGDFIAQLSSPSNPPGRVIITSTTVSGVAFKGLDEQDGIPAGSYFLDELLRELGRGIDFKQSFEAAGERARLISRADDSSLTALQQFADNNLQRPLLDDNGDGSGSHVLANDVLINGMQQDGEQAESVYLGFGVTQPPDDFNVTSTKYLTAPGMEQLTITTTNLNWDDGLAAIRAPGSVISAPTGNTMQSSLPYVTLAMAQVPGTINFSLFSLDTNFAQSGQYEVRYWGESTGSGKVSITKNSVVYVDSVGNQPPDPFALVWPVQGGAYGKKPHLSWVNTTDPDGDAVTYTVLFSNSGNSDTGTGILQQINYQAEALERPEFVPPYGFNYDVNCSNDEFFVTCYWQVLAIDRYGAIRTSEIRYFSPYVFTAYAVTLSGRVTHSGGTAGLAGATVAWNPDTSDATNIPGSDDSQGSEGLFVIASAVVLNTENFVGTMNTTKTGYQPGGDNVSCLSSKCKIVLDLLLLDVDNDGVADIYDAFQTDPAASVDTDGDGMPDSWNLGYTGSTISPGMIEDLDDDNDELLDTAETSWATNPLVPDTDGDGVYDGVEVKTGTDPKDPASFIWGDVNADGEVNIADVLLVTQFVLGTRTPDATQALRTDVAPLQTGIPNPDGLINVGDLLLIQRKALGLVNF